MHWLDVLAQPRAMRLLQMALAGGRMPHAWLFYGPSGVGKEMLALRLARILLCEKPVPIEAPPESGEPSQWIDACGQCRSCHLVAADTHPDLHVVYREINRFHPDKSVRDRRPLDISVDVARHFVLDAARARSAMGRAKVFLIRDADTLSTAAQNALLKTLEEPPEDTYLVLLSAARDRLLPTTNSRCQAVSFAPLDEATTHRILVACGMAEHEAAFYAGLSGGRPGWALEMSPMQVHQDYGRIAEGMAQLATGEPVRIAADWQSIAQGWAKLVEAARAEEKAQKQQHGEPETEEEETETPTDILRLALQVFFVTMNHILAAAMRIGAGAAGQPPTPQAASAIRELARWGPQRLARAIPLVNAADSAVARNANSALTLEGLGVKLAQISRGSLAGSLDQA